jgi:hypothetical protein
MDDPKANRADDFEQAGFDADMRRRTAGEQHCGPSVECRKGNSRATDPALMAADSEYGTRVAKALGLKS